MRLTIARADLVRVLTRVEKVVEPKSTYPLLSNVHLSAADGTLTVRGTDMDIEISVSCQAEVITPGIITIPARKTLDIARRMEGERVTIELNGDVATVKSGRSVFKLATLPADAFPTINAGEFAANITVDFSKMLPPVVFAVAANDPSRHYLEGVYLHEHEGSLRAVGADGNRLAYQVGGAVKPFPGFILPRKVVGLLSAFAGGVAVEVSTTKLRATFGDTVLVCKLIEGAYVDYNKFWPKGNPNIMTTGRAELRSAVDRVGLVANERAGRGVRLSDVRGEAHEERRRGGDGCGA